MRQRTPAVRGRLATPFLRVYPVLSTRGKALPATVLGNPNDAPDTDYTGYDFWLTKLNQFNGNYINAEMVKAFLSSIEYRQRFGP